MLQKFLEAKLQSNSIESLLEFIDSEPRISHRVIARETENKILSVQKLITDNLYELELFGHPRFKIETVKNSVGAINEEKTYYLNEPQATLLLTFMRNNEIVKSFKIRLVKEFYRMRDEIKSKNQTVQVQNETLDLDFYTQQSEKIFKLVQLINSQNTKTLYFADNLYKKLNLQSPLELLKIDLENYYFIPTELGNFINTTAVETNKILEAHGFQIRENGVWVLTEKGHDFGIEVQNGSFLQIKWKLKAIFE
jgi:phage regulator Rha-like protein